MLLTCLSMYSQPTTDKNRVIVLTDIEADPDDAQSLIRLLLYSNSIDIKGIVATTSVHQKARVAPESVKAILQAYEVVQPNLLNHEEGFPKADALMATVKQGLPVYGMQGVGDDKDSEGSDWIIEVLEERDDRPLWISVWGGPNTLAQALYKITKTKSAVEAERLIAMLRVYTISDQDDSGLWIRKNYPDLFYVVSPGGYQHATWMGINKFIPGIDNKEISNSWLAENIQQGHGPLGAMYPDVAYGMEGDTPAYLGLIPNGLNESEHPEWGGWGGRYEFYMPKALAEGFTGGIPVEKETRSIWTNASDQYSPYVPNEYGRSVRLDTTSFNHNQVTLWRWRKEIQNDFAARMDWCLTSYQNANHPPVPALAHDDRITVKSGDTFSLDASGTEDPDGDNLSYLWFHYPEAGSYKKRIKFSPYSENLYNVHTVKAPQVENPETAHFILKVTDKGTPALTRYKRVIVEILPK